MVNPVPRFQDAFLENLAFAFRKRRKALTHQVRVEFAKVYEAAGSKETERLEVSVLRYDDAWLRLHAWPNRQIWLDARRREKTGPRWSWSFEGRLLDERLAPEVVKALEETIALLFEMDAPRTHVLNGPWARLLAQGPRAVR